MRFVARTFALIFVCLSALTGPAHAEGHGLPIDVVVGDGFRDIDKTVTICPKCKDAEAAFHAAVDRYDAERANYGRLADQVRAAADRFVRHRDLIDSTRDEAAKLDAFAEEMRAEDAYTREDYVRPEDAREAASQAWERYYDAVDELPAIRAGLDGALDALEVQRTRTVEAMQAALRLDSAMFSCETACAVDELDLDVRVGQPEPPASVALIDPGQIPTPENFMGIVAACAECQPLADRVNQIRSHRRSFASSAEMLYASLTNNQRTLERLTREATALEAEERDVYQRLARDFKGAEPPDGSDRIDFILDRLDQKDATDALRDIAARRAQVARDMAGIAQTIQRQFDGLLEALANYHAHTVLLEAAQKALAECEKDCPPPPPDPANDPFTDPAYPIPENIDPLAAKCWECQPLADALVKTLVERRGVAGDIQSVVWLLKGRHREIEEKSARLDAIAEESRQMGALLKIGKEGGANVDYALKRLFELEDEETQLVQDVLAAEGEIPGLEKSRDELMARHAALSKLAAEQRGALEICEFNKCQPAGDDPLVSLPGPLADPAYPVPEPFTYVATDCLSCQSLADQINALLLEKYVLAGRIQSAAAQIKSHRAALADKQAELPELADRIATFGPPYVLAEDPAEKARLAVPLDAAIDAERRVKAEIEVLEKLISDAGAELEAMVARHGAIDGEVAALGRRLAECEKNCADPDEPDEDIFLAGEDPFVATDCAPCQILASQVNDAVGSLIGAQRALAAAKKAFDDLVAEAKARDDRLAELDREISDLSPLWAATYIDPDRAAEHAEVDKRFDALDLEQRRLQEEKGGEDAARSEALKAIDDAQQTVDDLHVLIAALKVKLLDCEKQCQPPDEGNIALPEPPFVSTDCEPCLVVASRINDVVGTLIGLRRQVEAAKADLAALREKSAALDADLTAAKAAYDQLQDDFFKPENRERQDDLQPGLWEADDAQIAAGDAVQDNAFAIEKAVQEAARLDAEIVRLEAAEADLRAQLAECEQKCQPPADGTAVAVPESPFVTTDCEACVVLASMVNDAVGSRIGAERRLMDARDRRAALEREQAERQAKIDEIRGKLDENRKARLETSNMDDYEPLFDEGEALGDALLPLEWEQEDAPEKIEKADAEIAALEAEIARLTQQEADLKARLAECEKTCNQPDETAMGQPDPSPFVTTDCDKCQVLASMVNDAVGSHIGAEREAQAQRDRVAGIREKIAKKQGEVDAATDAVDKSFLEDDLDILNVDLEFAQSDLEKAEGKVAELARQVEALKAKLAECEKQCAPGAEDTDETAMAPAPDPRFVTTDCEPCLQTAAALNDVLGSIIGVEDRLASARAEHDRLAGELARVDAAVEAAQDAFAAAAVEKARLEAAGQDASAQKAAFDENLDRASELSTRSDELFPGVTEAAERVAGIEAELETLKTQEAQLRAALEECERQCGGSTAAGIAPDMLLDKVQPDGCKAGGACTFELGATNQSDGSYRGPIFLTETGRVDAGANGALFDGWHCSPAAGPNSICLHEGEVAAGERVGLTIPIRLPGYVGAGTQNCIRIEFATDQRKLLQFIQVGLAARGLNPGSADGLMGPRTRAAIVALGAAMGQEVDPNDLDAVYRLMFGAGPVEAGEGGEACIDMEVENPPRPVTTRTTTPRTTPTQPQPTPRTTLPRPQFNIGIGIGTGGENRGGEVEGGHAGPGIGGLGFELRFGD